MVFLNLPPSVNNNYEKQIFTNNKTGKSIIHMELSKPVVDFRVLVRNTFIKNGIRLKPSSVLVHVIELYSPKWLNKNFTSKQKDADNLIKPLFDAIEEAQKIPDEINHEIYVFKMYSKKEYCVDRIYEIENILYEN